MRETWVRSLSWEDPLGEGKGNPLQYSGLENSMDCIVHGVAKSRARLSDFRFTSQLRLLLFLQKTFRDHPVSAKQPPPRSHYSLQFHTPKPSIAHARCQRKTIQKQTAPEHPSVTLPRPWLCRLYRRSSREEAVESGEQDRNRRHLGSAPSGIALPGPDVTQGSAQARGALAGLPG